MSTVQTGGRLFNFEKHKIMFDQDFIFKIHLRISSTQGIFIILNNFVLRLTRRWER